MTIKELQKVKSSNIEAIGYSGSDPDTGNLFVKYVNGLTYTYEKVPKKVYEALYNSESKGKFMNENVKGKYEYKKVDLK